MDVALKLQKEAATAMETAVAFQTEYMAIYNQLLGSQKEWIPSDIDLEALEPDEIDEMLQEMMQMMAKSEGKN